MKENKMVAKNVDVLVGLSFGSEAKGKLLSSLAMRKPWDILVRTGSVNAAHTTYINGEGLPWHQLTCIGLHNPKAPIVLGAGAQIDKYYLNREIGWLKDRNAWFIDGKPRLRIDPNATIIDAVDVRAENGWADICGPEWYAPTTCQFHNGTKGKFGAEKPAGGCMGCEAYPADSLHKSLGSTTHGSGYNLIRKLARITADGEFAGMLRDPSGAKVPRVKLAKEDADLAEYMCDTVELLNSANDEGKRIILEGTQGSPLSVHHGPWPKTTSRDTNASNWFMEAGLSPATCNKIYGVTRTFPIRVAGASGAMGGRELTWEEVTKYHYSLAPDMTNDQLAQWLHNNAKKELREITTATKRQRRVSEFHIPSFKRAISINRPDEMMLSFIDYINYEDFNKDAWDSLSEKSKNWILNLEHEAGVFFKYLSTGPSESAFIVRE
jgi:adenylosuccinate synthase